MTQQLSTVAIDLGGITKKCGNREKAVYPRG
jgi:hypothetical protein